MKNRILLILLVLFIIPKSGFAQEVFFLTYPDGHDEGVGNYIKNYNTKCELKNNPYPPGTNVGEYPGPVDPRNGQEVPFIPH